MIEPRVRPISQHLFAELLPFMQFGPQWEMQNPTPERIDSQLLVQGKTLFDQTEVLCRFMLLKNMGLLSDGWNISVIVVTSSVIIHPSLLTGCGALRDLLSSQLIIILAFHALASFSK